MPYCVAFLSDGRSFVGGVALSNKIYLWQTGKSKPTQHVGSELAHGSALDIDVSSNGGRVAAAREKGNIELIATDGWTSVGVFEGHKG